LTIFATFTVGKSYCKVVKMSKIDHFGWPKMAKNRQKWPKIQKFQDFSKIFNFC
jgi:hypothetical protein